LIGEIGAITLVALVIEPGWERAGAEWPARIDPEERLYTLVFDGSAYAVIVRRAGGRWFVVDFRKTWMA
jgi:hypothetical protein